MFHHSICHKRCFLWQNNILSLMIGIIVMKISFATNSMGISDKIKFCHVILSLMLGFPVVSSDDCHAPPRSKIAARSQWLLNVLALG
jgi:hypothetical protein